jgi:hypothetical protein
VNRRFEDRLRSFECIGPSMILCIVQNRTKRRSFHGEPLFEFALRYPPNIISQIKSG